MRFGSFVPQGWRLSLSGIDVDQHWPVMLGVARDIEALGFDSLWVYDHFHTVPEPTQESRRGVDLMSALAAITDGSIGPMHLQHLSTTVLFAKVASSADVISGDQRWASGPAVHEHEHRGRPVPVAWGTPRDVA
jgi:alkanesulfonate monooxygenase SsuD/methylene tetrahydromethanopterin reductase-like flavin-dependent oxidoreductase (luciferase family)